MTTQSKPSKNGFKLASRPDRVFQIRIPDGKVMEFVEAVAQVKLYGKVKHLNKEAKTFLDNICFDKHVVEECIRPNLMIEEIFPRVINLRQKLLKKFGKRPSVANLFKRTDKEFLESPWIQLVAWMYYVKYLETKLAPYQDRLELEVVLMKLNSEMKFDLPQGVKSRQKSPVLGWINKMKNDLSKNYKKDDLEAMTHLHSGFNLYYDFFYKLFHPNVNSRIKKSIYNKLIVAINSFITQECHDAKKPLVYTLVGYIASDAGYLISEKEFGKDRSIPFNEYLQDKVALAVKEGNAKNRSEKRVKI